jgi:hypothetical protein
MRGALARRADGTILRAEHDVWGHPFDEANTLHTAGTRVCRHCLRVRARAQRCGMTLAEYYAKFPQALAMSS